MDYKGVSIQLNEYVDQHPLQRQNPVNGRTLNWINSKGIFFVAGSVHGVAIAKNPQQALDDVKRLIDGALRIR